MSHMQQCVLPEECVCEVAGVRYWPDQQIKVDCEICVCERGRPQRCQPNPDCSGESVKYTDSGVSFQSTVDFYPHTGYSSSALTSEQSYTVSFVLLQCTVAGHHGPSGESVWGPVVFRVSSGRSAAQTTPPSMETGERVEEFTGKPAGMKPSPHGTVNYFYCFYCC